MPLSGSEREIFCNRTLNLRRIKAIGYDMDYTLVHYHVDKWEALAFAHMKQRLLEMSWPVEELEFDPSTVIRGLIVDTEKGNIVKANRFGYIKASAHGTRLLHRTEQRRIYARTIVDLSERRWRFMNTFFSLSELSMYAQLVDKFDAGGVPQVSSYADLYEQVRSALDEAHMAGQLKADIVAKPEEYMELDPNVALTLLDQKAAGKKLLLITNSEWAYTNQMMSYAIEPYLPDGMKWPELFDLRIVAARKPAFFEARQPVYEVTSGGLLRSWNRTSAPAHVYHGGSASFVEEQLGISGDDILYIGDHIYGDVHVSKSVRRWRTGLILRELEDEIEALEAFGDTDEELRKIMAQKTELEDRMSKTRLLRQRVEAGYGEPVEQTAEELAATFQSLREQVVALDQKIAPLAIRASALHNSQWGLLLRAGNDKSHLARQIERHADIYTSRVANFAGATPFVYLRSTRGVMPHESHEPLNPFSTGSEG